MLRVMNSDFPSNWIEITTVRWVTASLKCKKGNCSSPLGPACESWQWKHILKSLFILWSSIFKIVSFCKMSKFTFVVPLSQMDWTLRSPSLHGNAMAKLKSTVHLLNVSISFFCSVFLSYLPPNVCLSGKTVLLHIMELPF